MSTQDQFHRAFNFKGLKETTPTKMVMSSEVMGIPQIPLPPKTEMQLQLEDDMRVACESTREWSHSDIAKRLVGIYRRDQCDTGMWDIALRLLSDLNELSDESIRI